MKNFLKSDAFGFFKKAIQAGGEINIDEKVLQKHFDSFLEGNSKKFAIGKNDTVPVTGTPGVKRKVKSTDYDWNKVIGSIGEDFGYEINFNSVRDLDGLVLEGDTYRKQYLDFYSQVQSQAGLANSPGGFKYKNGKMAPRSENRKKQMTKAEWKEEHRRSRWKPGYEAYEQGVDNGSKPDSFKTRTLGTVQSEWRGIDFDTKREALEYRKQQQGETVVQAYKGFGPFKKKANQITADVRGGVGHAKARELSDDMKKALGLLNEMEILNAGKSGIENAAHDSGMAKKVLGDATGKDGVGIWSKAWGFAKNHPVIATGAAVGTALGISELTEDDDF